MKAEAETLNAEGVISSFEEQLEGLQTELDAKADELDVMRGQLQDLQEGSGDGDSYLEQREQREREERDFEVGAEEAIRAYREALRMASLGDDEDEDDEEEEETEVHGRAEFLGERDSLDLEDKDAGGF